jgi:hypothetical protein
MSINITNRMPRGFVKVKKVKLGGKDGTDKDISEMFNQMLGAGEHINVNICHDKYCEIRDITKKIINVLDLMSTSPSLAAYEEMTDATMALKQYIKWANDQHAKIFTFKLPDRLLLAEQLDEEAKKRFSSLYMDIKKCDLVTDFISTLNNLIPYRLYIGDKDNLSYKFILSMPGISFTPFSFVDLDLKRLFILFSADMIENPTTTEEHQRAKAQAQMIQFLMLGINKFYTLSYNLYKVITSPDVNIEEFVDIVLSNIDELRKHIPRCNKAFDKIIDSVHMLKDNFSLYYKDFVETRNSTIIMEDFIRDVAKSTDADIELTRQFREIIKYYKKMAGQSANNNPHIKMIFEKANKSLKELEKHENIARAEKGEPPVEFEANSDDDSAPSVSPLDESEDEAATEKNES